MQTLVASPEQRKFGQDKRDTLTPQCLRCEVRPLCNGGCPKDRFVLSSDGEPGQNYLCPGLELFFTHTRPAMQTMAQLLQAGRPPADVMALTASRRREAWTLPALSLRQRTQVPILPRRQGAALSLRRKQAHDGATAVMGTAATYQ